MLEPPPHTGREKVGLPYVLKQRSKDGKRMTPWLEESMVKRRSVQVKLRLLNKRLRQMNHACKKNTQAYRIVIELSEL